MAIGRIKNYSSKEFNKILINNGFELVRKKGDHFIFKRGNEVAVTTNGGSKMNKMIMRRIIKEHDLKI